jgi:hypothetical protein
MQDQPSEKQINAVITWADRMGRFWRRELRGAWMDGNYQGNSDISHLLQQVRNEFGPEWLIKFSLKAAKEAQAEQRVTETVVAGPAVAPVLAPLATTYQLTLRRSLTRSFWSVRDPQNGNVYRGDAFNLDAAYDRAWAKIHELENAPTPTLPNGECI